MKLDNWWEENLAIPLCPEGEEKFSGLYIIGTCKNCKFYPHAADGECTEAGFFVPCYEENNNGEDFGCIYFKEKKKGEKNGH